MSGGGSNNRAIAQTVRNVMPSNSASSGIVPQMALPSVVAGQRLPNMGDPMQMGRPDFAALLARLAQQAPAGGYMLGPSLQMPQAPPPGAARGGAMAERGLGGAGIAMPFGGSMFGGASNLAGLNEMLQMRSMPRMETLQGLMR